MDDKDKMTSLVNRLRVFGTCEIADALIKLKLPSGGYLPGIDSHSPKSVLDICGPAFTVQMVSQQDTNAPKPEKHFVDATEGYEGHIMVISAPPDTRSAVWGGLMTNRAQFNGIKGCIIDGRCRDLQEQFDANFAIYSRGHSILGQSPFTRPSKLQTELEIKDPTSSSFPSTKVSPGDLIRADIDGVVVCPSDLVEKVIELATKGREVDGNCKNDLLQGKTIKETFANWRGK